MQKYIDYIVEQAKALLSIDSPTGYTKMAATYVIAELMTMDVDVQMTGKGGVLACLNPKETKEPMMMTSHCDTLGCMVHQIKDNGRLKMTPLGATHCENVETENCHIVTKSGKIYEGTCQLVNASCHVNDNYTVKRSWDNVEIVIDEPVKSKDDVKKLGIANGDFICFDPRTTVTRSGYIKSRFLDDKLSAAILLGFAKYVTEEKVPLKRKIYLHFTVFEEVGHGASASWPKDLTEVWSVDMGCVGEGLECTEHEVSICAKDSGGPYSYEVVSRMVEVAQKHDIKYAIDIYPSYASDVGATLSAGFDGKFGLIGPGVYASHGYERSHVDGVKNTFDLIRYYLED